MAEEDTKRSIKKGSNIPSIAATKQASVSVAMFGVRIILKSNEITFF